MRFDVLEPTQTSEQAPCFPRNDVDKEGSEQSILPKLLLQNLSSPHLAISVMWWVE